MKAERKSTARAARSEGELFLREASRVADAILAVIRVYRSCDLKREPATLRYAFEQADKALTMLSAIRKDGNVYSGAWEALLKAAFVAGKAHGAANVYMYRAKGNAIRKVDRRGAFLRAIRDKPLTPRQREALAEFLNIEPDSIARAQRRLRSRPQ